ncbi:hypothetical protein AAG906_028085 [Vitis piasezkii]
MIMGTNNKIIIIKRVNFKEEAEDVEATTQQLIDQSQQTSPIGYQTNFAEKEEEVSLLMVCHANEETQQNMWYLDIYNNHMCGEKKAFSEMNHYTLLILVTIQTKGNSTHTIANVFLPNLKTNLLSVDGVCHIQDAKLGLIAQVNMTVNRMFPLYLHNTAHLCFLAKLKDEAWLWHFHYGHLNFGD